jgi:hypothetical protein
MASANQIMKTLTIVDYLLKYGCSGCIDDFKEVLGIFRSYAEYRCDSDKNIFKLSMESSHIMGSSG